MTKAGVAACRCRPRGQFGALCEQIVGEARAAHPAVRIAARLLHEPSGFGDGSARRRSALRAVERWHGAQALKRHRLRKKGTLSDPGEPVID